MQTSYAPYALNPVIAPSSAVPMGTVLAVINNKGGVGKTTTAVSLAAALSFKHRVLLVDLDSQCSATLSLGAKPGGQGRGTLSEVMLEEVSVQRIIQPTGIEGLDLLPGSPDLAEAQLRLLYQRAPYQRLQRALDRVRMAYSFVILDCPPSFSVASYNALIAADQFIVPVVPHYLAVEGMNNLLATVERLRASGLPLAQLGGVVLTMVDYRTRAAREHALRIRERFPDLVFRNEIPHNIRLAEAPEQGKTIFEHEHGCRGARRYWQLAKELVHRVAQAERVAREPSKQPPLWQHLPLAK